MDIYHRFFGSCDGFGGSLGDQGRLAQTGFQKWLVKAELTGFFERVGAHAASNPFAIDFAVGIFVPIFELEEILRDDHVAFHADYFGNLRCPA